MIRRDNLTGVGVYVKAILRWNLMIKYDTKTWTGFMCLNPLTLNGHHSGHAVSPLNSRTTNKVAVNCVSKFGGILFTPIQLTAVDCYASGLLKVRLSFKGQNVPPPPPKPLPNTDILCRHFS